MDSPDAAPAAPVHGVGMTESPGIRVTAEILLEHDRIAGTVHAPDGRAARFTGWIGLIDALERCRCRGTHDSQGDTK